MSSKTDWNVITTAISSECWAVIIHIEVWFWSYSERMYRRANNTETELPHWCMKTIISEAQLLSKISIFILVKELTPHTKSSSAYPCSSFCQDGFCKLSAKLAQVAEPTEKSMGFIDLLLFGFGRRIMWLTGFLLYKKVNRKTFSGNL